ncbi:hypothetical protein DFA_09976 [Cavenderia fasciculata]|uniref:MRH domain-containing protein n=1 Tax=Cavenderia fasciculata TaxID=261658 RepID=F4Q8Y3_CACFS|nr:uncharacterized protein DFA_09976 [Cavenderia fasciculata]EGG15152.1 hypothetical protein DFA_09976 [Cavenderia fasciculata]|eukprot:XP_004351872.1 hypothetical protein DFA_09976 [Cavenderia fasciculata]
MMYYYYFILAFISSHFISGAFGTAPNCEYNGTNYIWSVCQPNLQCNSLLGATNIVSCQKPTTGTPQNTGLLSSGVWADSPGGGGAVVNYKSGTAPCKSSGKVRQTNVFFTCAPGQLDKVVAADESATKCVYEVFMSGKSACASSSSSSSSGSDVTCTLSRSGKLKVQYPGDTPINCTSQGVSECNAPGGFQCLGLLSSSSTRCSAPNEIVCQASSIVCRAGGMSCSIEGGQLSIRPDTVVVPGGDNSQSDSKTSNSSSTSTSFSLFTILLSLSIIAILI